MDVRAENRGRPHQKVHFSAAPVMGRNFLTQGRLRVRVRNVRGKSGPRSLCLCCFFLPEPRRLFLAERNRVPNTLLGAYPWAFFFCLPRGDPKDPSVLKTLRHSIP